MANATPSKYKLTIAGADYTTAFSEGQFSTSPFNEGDGLLLLTGQITLGQHNALLNPRLNKKLKPGNEVRLELLPGGLRAPLFGTMFIANSAYDAEQRKATLELTCLLGLLNYASFNEVGVCIENQEEGIALSAAIRQLLVLAGIPATSIYVTIPGTLYETRTIDQGSSFVQLAGELAFSQGYVLYQDRFGIIQQQKVSDKFAKTGAVLGLAESQLLQYTQKSDSTGVPPGVTRVSGNRLWPIKPDSATYSKSITNGQYGAIITEEAKTYDRGTRTAKIIRTVQSPVGDVSLDFIDNTINPRDAYDIVQSEYTVIEEEYEPKPEPWDCIIPDEGRLLKRVTQTFKPHFFTFGQAMLYKAEIDQANPIGNTTYFKKYLTLDTVRVETWTYDVPQNYPLQGEVLLSVGNWGSRILAKRLPEFDLLENTYKVKKRVLSSRPRSAAFPPCAIPATTVFAGAIFATGGTRLGRDPELETDTLGLSESVLQATNLETSEWTLNADGKTWREVSYVYAYQWQVFKDNVLFILDTTEDSDFGTRYMYKLQAALDAAFRLCTVDYNELSQTSPGEGGRFPARTTYGRTPYYIDGKVISGTSVASRRRDLQVPDGMPAEVAQQLAVTAVQRAWGRSNAMLINMPDDLMPRYFAPLGVIAVAEDSGYTFVYEADSISLALTPKEAYYACIGLLAGRYGTAGLPNTVLLPAGTVLPDGTVLATDTDVPYFATLPLGTDITTVVHTEADIWSEGLEQTSSIQFFTDVQFAVLQTGLSLDIGEVRFLGESSDVVVEVGTVYAIKDIITDEGSYIAYGD